MIDRFIVSEVFLARVKLARGDMAAAGAALAQAEADVRRNHFMQRMPEVAAAQVLVLLREKRCREAEHLARKHQLPLSLARVRLAQGEPAAALASLKPLRKQAEDKGWLDELLKVTVLQALARQVRQESDQALKLLAEALTLAEPGGLIRSLVDEGDPMIRLLEAARARGIAPDYVRKLLAAFETKSPSRQPLPEPLSPREMEVLQLIAQGLSNQEISERLCRALSTVKGHTQIIFEKLQVQRRTEAVARARELGLL